MPNDLIGVALALLLAAPAVGQSPPATPVPGSEPPQEEAGGKPSPPSPRRAQELPQRFVPTDKISPDSVISFPSDI